MRPGKAVRGLLVVSLAAFLVTLVGSGPLQAADRVEERLDQFETQLDDLSDSEGAEVAEADIDQARKWLDNARVLVAEGKSNTAERQLRRVKLSLDLIKALVAVERIEKVADEQEAVYYRARDEQLPELEEEIEELDERKDELQEEIERLEG